MNLSTCVLTSDSVSELELGPVMGLRELALLIGALITLLTNVVGLPLAYIEYPSPLQFYVGDSVVIRPTEVAGAIQLIDYTRD